MPIEPDVLLNARDAAKVLNLHFVTLNTMRIAKPMRGPPFRRLPGTDRIVYSKREILKWSEKGRVIPQTDAAMKQTAGGTHEPA